MQQLANSKTECIRQILVDRSKKYGHLRSCQTYKKRKSEIIMSLEKIINTLGHYAKDAWDTVKRSVNTVLALAALTTIISMGEAQGQSRKVQGDTLWGTGYFLTRDMITNEIIPNANLYLTPAEMQMVVPDITYEYQTGLTSTHFNLPVYIDSTVGIPERRNSKLLVFPSFGSDINILFENTEYGIISAQQK